MDPKFKNKSRGVGTNKNPNLVFGSKSNPHTLNNSFEKAFDFKRMLHWLKNKHNDKIP